MNTKLLKWSIEISSVKTVNFQSEEKTFLVFINQQKNIDLKNFMDAKFQLKLEKKLEIKSYLNEQMLIDLDNVWSSK